MPQAENEELPRKRWWLPLLIVILAVAVSAPLVTHLWRRWQTGRLIKSAVQLIDKQDFHAAELALRRAIQLSPTDVTANREMARLAEKIGLPAATDWHGAVARLNPGSVEDSLALATVALRQGRTEIAEQALKSIESIAGKSAQYHVSLAAVALARGKRAEAELQFLEAEKLEPNNKRVRYDVALMQLQSGDTAKAGEAIATLTELAKDGDMERLARRALAQQYYHEHKFDEALQWSSELQKSGGIEFRDRLLHLDIVRAAAPNQLDDAISVVKQAALQAPPVDAGAFISWMRMMNRAQGGYEWSETLDPKRGNHPRVAAARCECLIVLKRWDELSAITREGNWYDLEYARLAYQTRAAKELNPDFDTRPRWQLAIQRARGRDQIAKLAWMANEWRWIREQKEALWAAVKQSRSDWAMQLLHEIYAREGDTETLLHLAQMALERDSQNPRARNNVAMLSLLVGRNTEAAVRMARELYESDPKQAAFASTYALALHAAGQDAEGLALLSKLSPEQLAYPSIAATHAVLLAASGDTADALAAKQLALKGPLLPQEKAMIDGIK